MLSELTAHTVDSRGYRTFATGKHLKKIIKFANLKGFSIYFDPEATLWKPTTEWKSMRPEEWDAHFLLDIKDHTDIHEQPSDTLPYLLRPISGHLKSKWSSEMDEHGVVFRYHQNRHIQGHRWPETEPTRSMDVSLKDVNVVISRRQYEHVQNLLTVVNLYQVLDWVLPVSLWM